MSITRPWGSTPKLIVNLAIVGLCVLVLGFATTTGHGTARDHGATSNSWNRDGAAKYLDERMEVWFANAKKLRTGQAQTACVSCHTTLPYMLARPALRRATHVVVLTPHENRILEETKRRVENYDNRQLFYDFNEYKKTESRGTEAVLNALILANADATQGRREPSATTEQALEQLWRAQRPDGAWDWLDFGLEPYETVDATYYGATLAALAIGIAPLSSKGSVGAAKAGSDKLRGYLKRNCDAQSLFNRTWLLLASTRWNDLLTKVRREALIAEILSRQHDDGGWSLNSLATWKWSKLAAPFRAPGTLDATLLAQSDGYATGLIVYALRRAGLSASHPAVRRGLQWLVANQRGVEVNQHAWPAWRAYSLNFDREHGGEKGEHWRRMFMSDSATAFAVLALVGS